MSCKVPMVQIDFREIEKSSSAKSSLGHIILWENKDKSNFYCLLGARIDKNSWPACLLLW